eukprot:COSAG01_NODE_20668_length_941_cov_1.171021_1_plen_67_part_10
MLQHFNFWCWQASPSYPLEHAYPHAHTATAAVIPGIPSYRSASCFSAASTTKRRSVAMPPPSPTEKG